MGAKGREHVRRNFLIPRHLRDVLLLMLISLYACAGEPVRFHGKTLRPAAR